MKKDMFSKTNIYILTDTINHTLCQTNVSIYENWVIFRKIDGEHLTLTLTVKMFITKLEQKAS